MFDIIKGSHMMHDSDRHVVAYDIVRAFAMLLVVFGHSSYYSIMTPFGGVDYMEQLLVAGGTNPAIHDWLDYIIGGIYMFHMRVFFALSGAVFYLRLRQGAYQHGLAAFVQKKVRRLLVPFLLVATFYAIPLKAISGYWAGDAHALRDILLGQYLLLGNSHLWFLVVMFFAFVILGGCVFGSARIRAWLLAPRTLRAKLGVLVVLLVLLLADGTICHLAQNRIHRNGGCWLWFENFTWNACAVGWGALWMMIGMMLERMRQRFADVRPSISAPVLAVLSGVLLVALCGGYAGETHYVLPPGKLPVMLDEMMRLGLAVLGVAFCFCLGACLSRTRAAGTRWIHALSRDSMGIYLYSDPLNYVLLASFAACFGISAFGMPQFSLLIVITRFIVTLAIGWGVTLLLRRFSRAV